jgi:hypothetical protein
MSSPAGGSGRIRTRRARSRADLLDAVNHLADGLGGPDVQRLRLALGPLKPLVASLIFAWRPRGVELRFSSPPKSQGTLAQAGEWPKLDRGFARRGPSATF